VAAALTAAGRSVVLIDARGHGESDKPHEPAAYAGDAMTRDAQGLLDHLGLDSVDVVGYSMGSLVAMELAGRDPRVRSLILGGTGRPPDAGTATNQARLIAEGLEAAERAAITDPTAVAFRHFADATGADLLALAAWQRSCRPVPDMVALGQISVPTLVLNGEKDTLVRSPEWLTEAIPGARLRLVPGDHLSVVVKPEFTRAILEFLPAVAPPP